jgi:hypothetical protein
VSALATFGMTGVLVRNHQRYARAPNYDVIESAAEPSRAE